MLNVLPAISSRRYAAQSVLLPAAEDCAQYVADALKELAADSRGGAYGRPAAAEVVRIRRLMRCANLMLDGLLDGLLGRSLEARCTTAALDLP